MRYAEPPVGELRWRAPQDPRPVTGVQSAVKLPPICIGLGETASVNITEDCLFVNVFSPSDATTASNYPVWVYIQGGGFVTNANANYNGSDLVVQSNHSVIVVNFNYRVGPLGFLAGEEVRDEGDLNVGLLDQRKLLFWVQEYIHLFGGNRDRVVIHGASAGAASVTHHLAAYDGRDDGLFVGAIGESIAWTPTLTVTESEPNFQELASRLNCSEPSRISCLRTLDATVIQTFGHAPQEELVSLPTKLLFQPVIDNTLFTNTLYSLFQQGKFLDVPVIVGYDTNEGSLFAPNASTPAEVAEFVRSWSPRLSNSEIQQIVHMYPPSEPVPGRAPYFSSASSTFAEGIFFCPTTWISTSIALYSSSPSWTYRYNVLDDIAISAGLGVPHTFETEAIFGPGQAESIRPGFLGAGASYSTYNAGIVPVIQGYLTSFVKTLDPNPLRSATSPIWQSFGAKSHKRIMLQTNNTAMETIPHSLAERCAYWYSLEDSIVGNTP
ncbi:hypothetical protein BDV12DRAFT_180605 [Aspergillus spectabilis]